MKDERIAEALKALPRERASAGFTAGVLERLDRRSSGAHLQRWMLTAAAVLLFGLGWGWREWQMHRDHQESRARYELLLVEKQALETELRTLRRLTEQAMPVVYLGGNERVDLVLDLARLQRRGGLQIDPRAATGIGPAVQTDHHPTPRNVVY